MIQPLRTVHRRAFVVLGFVLPAILLAGLGARRSHQRQGTQVASKPASASLISKSDGLWRKHRIQSEFYRDSAHPQQIYVVLGAAQDLGEPDLLLYWTGDEPQGKSLPAHAHLLGAFAPDHPFALPQLPLSPDNGYLVLYSLAHQIAVDSAALEKLP